MDLKPYFIGGAMALMALVTLASAILAYRLYGWWNKAKEERDTAQADLQAEKDVSDARKEMADEAHQEHTKTVQRLGELQAALQERERTVEMLATDTADWKRKYQQAQTELARLTRPAGSADTAVLPEAETLAPVVAKAALGEAKVTWAGDVPAGTSASGESVASEAPAANGTKRTRGSRKRAAE